MRQNERKNEVNGRNRGRLRTQIKELRAAIETGNTATAKEMLPQTISLIDKSIQKGVLHQNAAARYKSRLTTRVGKMAR